MARHLFKFRTFHPSSFLLRLSMSSTNQIMWNQWMNSALEIKSNFDQFSMRSASIIYTKALRICLFKKVNIIPFGPFRLYSILLAVTRLKENTQSLNTCPTLAVSITCITSFKQRRKLGKFHLSFRSLQRMRARCVWINIQPHNI